ncbi:MAG: uracil-DNA glycosylase [Spirochaetota bacterium]|jgi:DNA polymerase|nr:uracil-DNA glycosylase [Spirochaetota bacterium]
MSHSEARDELLRITLLAQAWLLEQPRPELNTEQTYPPSESPAPAAPAATAIYGSASSSAPAPVAHTAAIDRAQALLALRAQIGDCARCAIARDRHNLVFGQGSPYARLMIVGEGPGEQEDLQGIAFCGPSGELLTKMLAAIGLARDEVYIANVIKCRPPHNRDPLPEEVANCRGWLDAQIDIIRPGLLCSAGSVAAKTLLGVQTGITRLHGVLQNYHGIPLVPTFHPAYLLRDPSRKKDAWKDLQYIQRLLSEIPDA